MSARSIFKLNPFNKKTILIDFIILINSLIWVLERQSYFHYFVRDLYNPFKQIQFFIFKHSLNEVSFLNSTIHIQLNFLSEGFLLSKYEDSTTP